MVDFTDLSTGDVLTWDWDFGDGGTSADQDPIHEYTTAGVYTVTLVITDYDGGDTATKTDYITVGTAGAAAFSATPTEGIMGMTVDFTDESTGDVVAWEWDFGDVESSTDQSPSHVYADPNIYDVSLTVTDAYGSDTGTKNQYIWVGFLDCGPDNWAFEDTLLCVYSGIVQGYEGGYYEPTWPVNRGQMAVYISRTLAGGDSGVPDATPPATFDDVPSDHWAWDYVEYAVAANVVSGYNPTTYAPEVEVDRGQMAVFIARATGWITLGDPMDTAPELFPDVPAGFWSGTAIQACVDNLVVQGYTDGNYHPEYVVTRDQMAVYVARAFGLGT
jgi:PKD repeat protein